MPSERFYLDEVYRLDESVSIQDAEFHHLVRVMRGRQGDLIELVNGNGSLAKAEITEIKRNSCLVKILNVHQEQPSPPSLILFQAFCKQNRLDWAVEKTTELGIDELVLFPGEKSESSTFYPKQKERVVSLMIAAMKQSGRLFLPKFHLSPSIDHWSQLESTTFFGDLDETAPPLLKAWNTSQKQTPYVFITGPEKGFSQNEIERLKKLGAIGTHLHQNILRTETASVVAVSLLSHLVMGHS